MAECGNVNDNIKTKPKKCDCGEETDKSGDAHVEKESGQGEDTNEDVESKADSIPDCPVCLQTCSYPVKLACGHIFCFLCIKGVVIRSRRCALCRQDVGLDYFRNPVIIKSTNKEHEKKAIVTIDDEGEYQWYYEGRNGWWQYDDLSSAELEKSHKEGNRSCELLIAGFLYFIDFENMVQFRKTEPGRRRRIKRDVLDAEKKGVAGLQIGNQIASQQSEPRSRQNHSSTHSADYNASVSTRTDRNPPTGIQRLVVGSSSKDETPTTPNKNPSS